MNIDQIPFASAINAFVLLLPMLAEFSFGNYFWHISMVCRIIWWGVWMQKREEDGSYQEWAEYSRMIKSKKNEKNLINDFKLRRCLNKFPLITFAI
jgi:hypothetical protein